MFSSRFTWSLTTNRLSAILESKRAAGIPVLDLTESNPTRAGFKYDEPGLLRALAQPQSLLYEPDPRGLLSTRQAVVDYYRARGQHANAEAIHLTASTSEGYAYLFKLLANPGDEMLAPQPSYPLLDFLTALESVQLVHYPLWYHAGRGWQIDLEKLAATISTKTVALVLVNPNNPTGSFLKHNELEQLNLLCAEHKLTLICDEVFSDYAAGEDAQRVPSLVNNQAALTFVLSGLSKIAGLPQVKLGWIHVSGPKSLHAEAQERLDFITDTYLSVGTPVQHATPGLLALSRDLQVQIKQRLTENERTLAEACAELSPCRMLEREGGWYAVFEIQKEFSEEEFTISLLEQDDVLVHPGYFFDFPKGGFLVVSLLTIPEIFREGIFRMIDKLTRQG